MKIAIRKFNDKIEICKDAYTRTREEILPDESLPMSERIQNVVIFTEEMLSQEPYNYTPLEIEDKYADCEVSDFNDDLTFNVEKYNERKSKVVEVDLKYAIVSKIREKYSLDDELAILRQRDTKPEEFAEYNAYVEQCKREVKGE